MKSKIILKNNGQALVELGVFGTLILIALSVLLMYGQRFDAQQQAKMEAFRYALERAYNTNGVVSYNYKKDTRFANVFGGYRQGQGSTVGGSASVMWVKGMPGKYKTESEGTYSYARYNDTMAGDPDEGLPRQRKAVYYKGLERKTDGVSSGDGPLVPVSVWQENRARVEMYEGENNKTEKPGEGIKNTRKGVLKDQIVTNIKTRFDNSATAPNSDTIAIPDYQGQPSLTPNLPEFTQNAQYSTDPEYNNRIEYVKTADDSAPAEAINETRKWETGE